MGTTREREPTTGELDILVERGLEEGCLELSGAPALVIAAD